MSNHVLIVDDDPIVGSLTQELLQDAGMNARLVQDSLKAMDAIKQDKPDLVILDILMPGLDGLTLLHRLKSDPETAKVRVIIVSGKSFEAEKTRAKTLGAELFVEKPYDVESFAKTVAGLLGAEPQAAAAAPAPKAKAPVRAKVWDSRAPCVSVEAGGRLFVFDAGPGLKPLGDALAAEGRLGQDIWLFLSHFHEGHAEGLADFARRLSPASTLRLSGASEPDKSLEKSVEELFAGGPAPEAALELYSLLEQTYEILPGVRLSAFYANHPGSTLGFSLQAEGRRVIYCPDSEIYGESATALQDYDEKLGALCREADLLFHDASWTEEDYQTHRNGGHSSFLAAVDFAARHGVKRLALVHQDKRYSEADLKAMEAAAKARAAESGGKLAVSLGRAGLTLEL